MAPPRNLRREKSINIAGSRLYRSTDQITRANSQIAGPFAVLRRRRPGLGAKLHISGWYFGRYVDRHRRSDVGLALLQTAVNAHLLVQALAGEEVL